MTLKKALFQDKMTCKSIRKAKSSQIYDDITFVIIITQTGHQCPNSMYFILECISFYFISSLWDLKMDMDFHTRIICLPGNSSVECFLFFAFF